MVACLVVEKRRNAGCPPFVDGWMDGWPRPPYAAPAGVEAVEAARDGPIHTLFQGMASDDHASKVGRSVVVAPVHQVACVSTLPTPCVCVRLFGCSFWGGGTCLSVCLSAHARTHARTQGSGLVGMVAKVDRCGWTVEVHGYMPIQSNPIHVQCTSPTSKR